MLDQVGYRLSVLRSCGGTDLQAIERAGHTDGHPGVQERGSGGHAQGANQEECGERDNRAAGQSFKSHKQGRKSRFRGADVPCNRQAAQEP